ncbi:hypothetical protein [Neobacillus vireti]|uniref:hypothetical protein n=1 Tax=Neobacillus vireti TaxID=220686 RepID=UPI002FFDB844
MFSITNTILTATTMVVIPFPIVVIIGAGVKELIAIIVFLLNYHENKFLQV